MLAVMLCIMLAVILCIMLAVILCIMLAVILCIMLAVILCRMLAVMLCIMLAVILCIMLAVILCRMLAVILCRIIMSSSLLSKNVKIKVHRTITLPFVLCGFGTLSLTSREEHRLKVFEDRVRRKIFRPKWEEVTGKWTRLSNEEFYELYSSPNTIRMSKSKKMRLSGHVGRMGERRGTYRVLVGKCERKRPL
jgi:hypothetical protein